MPPILDDTYQTGSAAFLVNKLLLPIAGTVLHDWSNYEQILTLVTGLEARGSEGRQSWPSGGHLSWVWPLQGLQHLEATFIYKQEGSRSFQPEGQQYLRVHVLMYPHPISSSCVSLSSFLPVRALLASWETCRARALRFLFSSATQSHLRPDFKDSLLSGNKR